MFDSIYSAWPAMVDAISTFTAEVKAALIGVAGTLALAVITIWQIGRQAKHAVAQNEQNEARKLKLQIYENALEGFQKFADTLSEYDGFLRSIKMDLHFYRVSVASNTTPRPIRARTKRLNELNHALTARTMDLIQLIERWHVIDPRLYLFQMAMNAANYDVSQAFDHFFDAALRVFPVPATEQGNETGILPWGLPLEEDEKNLLVQLDTLLGKLDVSGSYAIDFQNELQKLLLGDLFNNKVRVRKPLDPRYVVLEIDKYSSLMRYFETESAWGKHLAELHVTTRIQIENQQRR
jgi:hypothetical protein